TTILLNIINLGTTMSFVKYATMLFGKNTKGVRVKSDIFAVSGAMLLGVTSLLTGMFGEVLSEFLFDFDLHVNMAEYTTKGIVYALMIVAGIAFYNGIIKHGGLITRIGHIELTFNGIITAMTGYFIVVVLFLNTIL
ncbi:MAG: hypothetical protein ABS873_03800, partial [Alkalibacterium sp.]